MKDNRDYAPQAPIKPWRDKYKEPTRRERMQLMTTGIVPPFYLGKQEIYDK